MRIVSVDTTFNNINLKNENVSAFVLQFFANTSHAVCVYRDMVSSSPCPRWTASLDLRLVHPLQK